ncbi:MAG: HlyC/CorC family transporter [Lachnospiraceae bacterium]|nr:HlyC/CorC family transporter [Lachnospiraceae bacterium]
MNTIVPQILLQLILILVNGFFTGTETAITFLNAGKLHKLEESGRKYAERLLKIAEEPEAFLLAIRMGRTLTAYLGAAFAAVNFAGYPVVWIYEELQFTLLPQKVLWVISLVLVLLLLSYFTMIFARLVPERIAEKKPLAWARASYGVVSALAVLLKPFIFLVRGTAGLILRVLHLQAEGDTESVTEEEIRMMVDKGEEKGSIDENEKEWIQNIFDFDDLSVRRVMTPRTDVIAVSLEDEPEEIVRLIEETGRSRYPVYSEDLNHIEGILYVRDFLLAMSRGERIELKEMMRPAYFVPESIHADVLFADMQKKKIHFAVIIDEYGAMEGIVTMEDLVEEIVGNIYDEFDPEEDPEIVQLEEGLFKVTGNTTIDDLAEELDMELHLEEESYETVGGLVISLLEAIPEDGVSFDVEGFDLHIHVEGEDIKDRRIERAYVTKLKVKEETAED